MPGATHETLALQEHRTFSLGRESTEALSHYRGLCVQNATSWEAEDPERAGRIWQAWRMFCAELQRRGVEVPT